MENWERRFDRMHMPDSHVPSHREGLRKRLQSNQIPGGHARRTSAALGVVALVMLGALTLGYPSWAKDLWKTAFVQTITLHTKDGNTVTIKKMTSDQCETICDTSACDSSWSTPDGRKYFRKGVRSGDDVNTQLRINMVCADTSRLTTVLQAGLEVPRPSGQTFTISSPDADKIWIVNGDTIAAENMTTAMDAMTDVNTETSEHLMDPAATTKDDLASLNTNFELFQNYPNPFNPTTQISFDLRRSGPVTLKVYNMMGQEIASLLNGPMNAGHHTVNFDGTHLPSGTYLYALDVGGLQTSMKMVLAK